ncbi:hypothetical protein AD998_02085 [bacterium 336/3]|nr:hypothetical protein AD998_02085 [bacterium 336/3]
MNDYIEIDLKLIINMGDKTASVKEIKVVEDPETMSFKEKAISYMRKQESLLAEQVKKFEVGVAASELSEQFRTEKLIAETQFWQVKSYLQVLELL